MTLINALEARWGELVSLRSGTDFVDSQKKSKCGLTFRERLPHMRNLSLFAEVTSDSESTSDSLVQIVCIA